MNELDWLLSKLTMVNNTFKILFLLLFTGCSIGTGQILDKVEINNLYEEVKQAERGIAECRRKNRAEQIRKFGKVLPRISGHCWEGCPVRVVKPYYPKQARQLKIKGEVRIETIVDKKGNVVYARAIKGPALLRRAALDAAYKSKYQRKLDCDKFPMKFRWVIRYRFHPSM